MPKNTSEGRKLLSAFCKHDDPNYKVVFARLEMNGTVI